MNLEQRDYTGLCGVQPFISAGKHMFQTDVILSDSLNELDRIRDYALRNKAFAVMLHGFCCAIINECNPNRDNFLYAWPDGTANHVVYTPHERKLLDLTYRDKSDRVAK